jgi:hypothetical protein
MVGQTNTLILLYKIFKVSSTISAALRAVLAKASGQKMEGVWGRKFFAREPLRFLWRAAGAPLLIRRNF